MGRATGTALVQTHRNVAVSKKLRSDSNVTRFTPQIPTLHRMTCTGFCTAAGPACRHGTQVKARL